MRVSHPARYSVQLLEHFAGLLDGYARVLDPMAGTGERLRSIRPDAYLNEIQPKWGMVSGAVCGDALHLPFLDGGFDAVIVSPTYGNRMADKFVDHQPEKKYKRNTYTHQHGAPLHPNNSGLLQWGEAYRTFHVQAWREVWRVLRPGGRFILNISDHIRNGKYINVSTWHMLVLENAFLQERVIEVITPRQRQGANGAARVPCEYIQVWMRK